MLAGIIGALLLYNFTLYTVLRYDFILCYCLGAAAMQFMGLCWSGGIFLFLPDLNTNEQISLTISPKNSAVPSKLRRHPRDGRLRSASVLPTGVLSTTRLGGWSFTLRIKRFTGRSMAVVIGSAMRQGHSPLNTVFRYPLRQPRFS
jgi:hypothetical protein